MLIPLCRPVGGFAGENRDASSLLQDMDYENPAGCRLAREELNHDFIPDVQSLRPGLAESLSVGHIFLI